MENEIKKLNSEILFHTRKMYGMFGQINFSVISIDRENKIIETSFKIKQEDKYRSDQLKQNIAKSIKHDLPDELKNYQVLVGESA